jgi:hypothetical protein
VIIGCITASECLRENTECRFMKRRLRDIGGTVKRRLGDTGLLGGVAKKKD